MPRRSFLFRTRVRGGFTLVEMLVVIAIIAILAALLLTALASAKAKAKDIACRNNLKQLSVCFHLYVNDNADEMPPNNSVNLSGGKKSLSRGLSWCPDDPANDTPTAAMTNVQTGVLFTYNRSLGIYHCPSDTSMIRKTTQIRYRSYNMSQSINGYQENTNKYLQTIADYKKFTQVCPHKNPKALGGGDFPIFVFIDEEWETMVDSQFGNPVGDKTKTLAKAQFWYDLPSDRHNLGCNFSFTDAHVEHTRWKVAKKDRFFHGANTVVQLAAGELPDLQFIQSRMKWWTDN